MSSSLRFLVDEDFDNSILRGVMRRIPHLEILRVQDVALSGAHDSIVLAWSAQAERILQTHDISTMKSHAYARISDSLPMPKIFVVSQSLPIGATIEAIILLAECSLPGEWEGQIRHLPL